MAVNTFRSSARPPTFVIYSEQIIADILLLLFVLILQPFLARPEYATPILPIFF